jgi:hypothetical protein
VCEVNFRDICLAHRAKSLKPKISITLASSEIHSKFSSEQAMKTQTGSRSIALPFNLGARWGGWLSACPAALPPGYKHGTHRIAGWVGQRAGLDGCGKSRSHREPVACPACSEWPYRLINAVRKIQVSSSYSENNDQYTSEQPRRKVVSSPPPPTLSTTIATTTTFRSLSLSHTVRHHQPSVFSQQLRRHNSAERKTTRLQSCKYKSVVPGKANTHSVLDNMVNPSAILARRTLTQF